MIECKITLPCVDTLGNDLFKEHNQLKEMLIRKFGLVHRIRAEMLTRAIESETHASHSGAFMCTYAFQYLIKCDVDDFTAFKIIAREIGHKCRLDFIDITYGYCSSETLDLADVKNDENWQAIANMRLQARERANSPWPKTEASPV